MGRTGRYMDSIRDAEILCWRPWVCRAARRLMWSMFGDPHSQWYEDAVQIGMLALCRAARKWRPGESSLVGYTGPTVVMEMRHYVDRLVHWCGDRRSKSGNVRLVNYEPAEENQSLADVAVDPDDGRDDWAELTEGLSPGDLAVAEAAFGGFGGPEQLRRAGLNTRERLRQRKNEIVARLRAGLID